MAHPIFRKNAKRNDRTSGKITFIYAATWEKEKKNDIYRQQRALIRMRMHTAKRVIVICHEHVSDYHRGERWRKGEALLARDATPAKVRSLQGK